MYGKAIILFTALFISFILQIENSLTFGQEQNAHFNGIWQRIDNDTFDDKVHLNQEGNHLTATFEPGGTCYENKNNPELGISYPFGKVEFSGDLVGNIIQGKQARCLIDERTTKLFDLKLTVSNDGKSLDGYTTLENGYQDQQRYIFVSSIVDQPSIEVSTDKPNYNFHENIGVSGKVGNIGTESEVLIQVYDPDEKQVFSRSVPINSDGSFATNFDFRNIDTNGTYRAFATYPNATGTPSADFAYGLPSKGFSAGDIGLATGTVVALGAGGIFLYKQGYIKSIKQLTKHGVKNGQASNLPVIYVGLECGIENPELPKSLNRNAIEVSEINRLEQAFSNAVDDILKNRKAIKKVQDDLEFIKWCKEAKENPKKVLSKISDDITNKFLSSISPYFGNLIVSEISVESDVSATRDKHKRIKESVQFNLVPIEPYIEFVLYVNTQRMSSAKFIFTIVTNVEVKNLTVNMTATDANVKEELQEGPEDNYDKKISIESLIFTIAVEFSRLKIGPVEKNMSPPVIIGRKKMEVKKFGSSHG
jgi:hypothetical protein